MHNWYNLLFWVSLVFLCISTPKGKCKFAPALRNSANTIENKKEGFLVMFFKKIAYKKGRVAARKIAVMISNMIVKTNKSITQ
jgi:hypothetical protein